MVQPKINLLKGNRITIRFSVLSVLNNSSELMCARRIAELANVSYDQSIFALHALHNNGKIYRQGKKTTALWGNINLKPEENNSLQLLQSIFNGFRKAISSN